jgi:hypothetical protein
MFRKILELHFETQSEGSRQQVENVRVRLALNVIVYYFVTAFGAGTRHYFQDYKFFLGGGVGGFGMIWFY